MAIRSPMMLAQQWQDFTIPCCLKLGGCPGNRWEGNLTCQQSRNGCDAQACTNLADAPTLYILAMFQDVAAKRQS